MSKSKLKQIISKKAMELSDYVVIRHDYNKYEIVKHNDKGIYGKYINSLTHYKLLRNAYTPIVLDIDCFN